MSTPVSAAATARNVGAILSRVWDLRVTAAHHVPRTGPALLVANHTGLLDGPLLGAVSPRPVRILAKASLFEGVFGRVLQLAGHIRLDYGGPDRSALHEALTALRAGGAVAIFPEAHRGRGDVARIRHGAAYVVARSNVPVVPVALLGTRPCGAPVTALPAPRATIHIVYGAPLRLGTADPGRRGEVAVLGEQLRQQLADHVALACRRTGTSLPELPGEADAPEVQEVAG